MAVRDGRVAMAADVYALSDAAYLTKDVATSTGYRSVLSVPMVREGSVIGAISVMRPKEGRFAEHEVGLLQTFADQAVIAIENARLFNETRDALARQTASADILRVISQSPTDVQPVFESIVSAGVRLFGGAAVAVSQPRDGQVVLRAFAGSGTRAAAWQATFPFPLTRDYVHGAALLDGRIVDIADANDDSLPHAVGRAHFLGSGFRAMTVVPMMREGVAIGAIAVVREQPGALGEQQLELLRTFADQAGIAIENVRLFNETKEALEQQQASADILRVISSSVSDAQPVFDKILQSSRHLFGSDETAVLLVDDEDQVTLGAYIGEQRDAVAATFPAPLSKSPAGHAIRERRVVHYTNATSDPQLTRAVRRVAQLAGYDAMAYAPMMWNERGIGAIGVSRLKGTFNEKELALLQTFADQAVIAIQNARMFNDTKVALERQTATAEILQVISSSRTELQPMFETIARRAAQLCDGLFANVLRYDGTMIHLAATNSSRPDFIELLRGRYPSPLDRSHISGKVIDSKSVVVLADALADPDYPHAFATAGGWRRMLGVPMLREGRVLGAIVVGWAQPGPVSKHHEELLKTFADQAAIAIENVRLFNETREALEQQTATADVLRVISESPTDVQPVCDVIADRAARLTDAEYGWVFRLQGDLIEVASSFGVNLAGLEAARAAFPLRLSRGSITGRAMLDRVVVNIPDLLAESGISESIKQLAHSTGYRSVLSVPMFRDQQVIGAVNVHRAAVGHFTEKEVALLRTFAAQAVIAIENVRLFNETKEALEQQTATAEILPRDQRLAHRCAAGFRRDRRASPAAVRGDRGGHHAFRWRAGASGRLPRWIARG